MLKNKDYFVIPTSIVSLHASRDEKHINVHFLDGRFFEIPMTIEEAEQEINDALNFTPHYKIDWSNERNRNPIKDIKQILKE